MSRPTDPDPGPLDLGPMDDAAFARQLLAAAAHDAPPPGASARAFRELASDAEGLAALTTLTALTPAAPARAWYRSRSAQRSPLGWLLLGAVAGGSVVALWLAPQVAPPAMPPVPPRPPLLQLAEPPLVPEPMPAPLLVPEPVPGETPRTSRNALSSSHEAPSSRAKPRASAELASRLAREVAALDAARAALAVGATSSVLGQIARYHREFPDGELTADADAVAIEALATQGDHAALVAAAQRFLQRHPHDPHAPRVRELAFIEPPAALIERPAAPSIERLAPRP